MPNNPFGKEIFPNPNPKTPHENADIIASDSSVGSSYWNNEDGTFTVSNSTSYNIYTNYIIPLNIGEKYRVSVEGKRINGAGGDIRFTLDAHNEYIYLDNTDNLGKEYEVYSKDIVIENTRFNNDYPHIKYLTFYFPKGEVNIKSIKVEELSDKLYLKNGNEIIITTTKNINDNPYVGDIKYYRNIAYYSIIRVIIILFVIYLIFLIVLLKDKIIYFIIKARTIIIDNKKLIFNIYGIFLISLFIIIFVLYLLGNISRKGYLSDFELIAESKAGYVYKAKLISKGIFSPNFIYKYSDKPLTLENKPANFASFF